MQTLKLTRHLLGLLLFVLTMNGCGWQKTMTFAAPSQNAAIELWQSRFDNSQRAQVRLVTRNRTVLLHNQPDEAGIYFVHVYWSPDETRVAVVATGYAIFNVAADVRTGKEIDFDSIRRDVARSIAATYRVTGEEDPIRWAATTSAQIAFFSQHPEIKLTYH